MESQQYNSRAEVDRLAASVAEKERENGKLWEQMRSATSEYHQEFLAKEATIAQLIAEQDSLRGTIENNNMRSQAAMEVSLFHISPLCAL